VTSVYDLQANGRTAGEDRCSFFCGVAANDLHLIFNVRFYPCRTFSLCHCGTTGIKNPQRLSMLSWKRTGLKCGKLAASLIFSAAAHECRTRRRLVLG